MSPDEDVSPRKQRRLAGGRRGRVVVSDDESPERVPTTSKTKARTAQTKPDIAAPSSAAAPADKHNRKRKKGRQSPDEDDEEEIDVTTISNGHQTPSENGDEQEMQEPSEDDDDDDPAEESSDDEEEETTTRNGRRQSLNDDGDDDFEEEASARLRMRTNTDEDCFEIPIRDADLDLPNNGYYIKDNSMTFDDAVARVEMFEDEVMQHRWRALYDRFPAFFYLVRSPSNTEDSPRPKVPTAVLSRLTNSLCLAYHHMSGRLKEVLTVAAGPSPSKKNRIHCRDLSDHLLMIVYLLHKLVLHFEDEKRNRSGGTKKKAPAARKPTRRGRKATIDDGDMMSGGDDEDAAEGGEEDESSWEENRIKVLETFTEMVNTTVPNTGATKDKSPTIDGALRFLWKTGEDKSMIRCLLDAALKFLESAEITRAASRCVLAAVFRLLRSICITFAYFKHVGGLLFLKLLSLDYYKDGSATAYPFIEMIKTVSYKSELGELPKGAWELALHELGRALALCWQMDDTDRLIKEMLNYFSITGVTVSQNNVKALVLFMNHVAEIDPYNMLLHLSPVVGLLSDENASVRSASLQVLTTLIHSSHMDDKSPKFSERFSNARSRMLERILQHVRDVNANVRAAAIKCLTSLTDKGKLPLSLISEGVVSLVGERLTDQKVAVRKEAVKFCTTFLLNNPYGHDLLRGENTRKLKNLVRQRDDMRKNPDQGAAHVKKADEIFTTYRPRLLVYLVNVAEAYITDEFVVPDLVKRKKLSKDLNAKLRDDRLGASPHSGDDDESENGNDEIMSFRELFAQSLLLDEKMAVEMLLSAALTNQLADQHVTLDDIKQMASAEHIAEAVLEAGHYVFIELTSKMLASSDNSALRVEQEAESRAAQEAKLNKEINDMVNKLIVEREIAACLPLVLSSVMQGEAGDLRNGIEFITMCKNFNITDSESAVRQLCGLVWKSDDEGRSLILQSASEMFLSNHHRESVRDSTTCENILNIVKQMSDHERGSIEEVFALTTKHHPIPSGVYNLLWEQVDEVHIEHPECKSKQVAAMKALGLLSRCDVDRNRKWLRRYQSIVKLGWPEIAAEALGCIANLATRHNQKEPEGKPAYRIPGNDSLFPTIQQFMLAELCREEARTWNRSLRATLDIYFHICKDTCEVVTQFVAKLLWLLRRTSQALHYYDQQIGRAEMHEPRVDDAVDDHEGVAGDEHEEEHHGGTATTDSIQKEHVAEDRSEYLTRLWSVLTERLCVLTGEIAIRFIVHVDLVYVREFTNARDRMMKAQLDGQMAPFPARSMKEWEIKSANRGGVFGWNTVVADETLAMGATDEEKLRIRSATILENRLTRTSKLMGRLVPIVVHCVRAKGSPPRVRFAAVNALAKLMMINSSLGHRGARTFFAFLNNAPSPPLRSNLVVAAADLTYRHPNLVEKHSASLFAQLQDEDSCVREACMLILNHLINNDLLKTHGVLSYALTGYVDPVPSIQHITRSMFNDWSKKDGVMSHVPDFISRLSRDTREVPLESFRTIMSHFIPLIRERKDFNVHLLVEKLCKRFEFAKSPRVIARNRDLPAYYSYCLSLMTLNTRAFHKMVDCMENYKQFLGDDRVYEDIRGLVATFAKEEMRSGTSDLSADVQGFLKLLDDLHDTVNREKMIEGKVAHWKSATETQTASGGNSQIARKMRSKRALAGAIVTPARGPTVGRLRTANASASTARKARGARRQHYLSDSDDDADDVVDHASDTSD